MFKRILVPVDGGPVSMLGLRQAIKLSALEGARLRLVHVIDEMPIVADAEMGILPDTIPALREGAQKVLAHAAAVAKRAGITAEISMIESVGGNTAEFVVSEAKKWRADVIVLGTHGRSGLERMLMGSAAEDIIRSTPVPVLLVRAKDEEEIAADRSAAKRRSTARAPAH
jgi:nucleotide-binding universal stress UspA family protein